MIVLTIVLPLFFAVLLLMTTLFKKPSAFTNLIFLMGLFSPTIVFFLFTEPVQIDMVLGGWESISGIAIGLNIYNRYFITAELIVFSLIGLYSILYYNEEPNRNKFFALILLMHGGMLGVFMSKDLFNMFVLMELVSVSAFILVAFSGGERSQKAAFRYLIFSIVASYIFLLSIGIIYVNTGSLNFEIIGQHIGRSREIDIAMVLAFSAMILKAGIFPLHFWLPDVYSESDTPICALLAGMTRRAPIYAMLMFTMYLPTAHLSHILMVIGFSSIFFGFFMALFQNDVWRLLAYASIGLMGIVLVGLATGNVLGTTYYVFAHAIISTGLFLTTGTLSDIQKTRNVRDLTYKTDMLIFSSVVMLSFALGSLAPSLNAYAKSELLTGMGQIPTILFQMGFVLAMLIMLKMNYLLWQDEGEKAPKIPVNLRSFLAAIPATLTIALGIYYYPVFVWTDLILLGAALAAFLTIKQLHVLEYKGIEKLGNYFRDLGTTNNYYSMVLFAFISVLLFYTL